MPVSVPLNAYRHNPIAYPWSGTAIGPFPAGNAWKGALSGTMTPGDVAVNSGIIKDTTPTGGANNGQYFVGRCYQDPLGSSLHYAEATHSDTSGGAGFPRGTGVGVGGSDSSFTNGVFAIGTAFGGTNGTAIITKVGSTLTIQASDTASWSTGDKLRLVISNNGTNNVYSVYKNVSTLVVQWIDSSNVINPGVWSSIALGGSWSSAFYGSHGATAFSCGDTVAGAVIYSYTFVANTHGPFNDWGQGYNVNSSAQANNNNAPAVNGTYYSGGVYPSPLSSTIHSADVTLCNIANGYDLGVGAAVGGSDSSFTNGVFAIATTVVGGSNSVSIVSKVSTTYTVQIGGGSGAWAQGDVMTIEARYNGTNYTYTVFKNSNNTGVSWTDTSNVITPGPYAGFAFRHSYSSGQYQANGIQGTWHAGDL